jgi:uncharacterized membrane protein YqgA involved in biofilm formation
MIGPILNVAGILAGGVAGLARRKPLSPASESYFRVLLAAFTVFYGLRLTCLSLGGSVAHVSRQVLIVLLALVLGRATGKLLRLQTMSNSLGQGARARIEAAGTGKPVPPGEGFITCSALFCAAPLGLLGAMQDGMGPGLPGGGLASGYFYPLAVKAVMDGLGTMGFVSVFGWGAMLSALPVLALEGTIALGSARFLKPFLEGHGLVETVNAVGGLLVFSVALVILGLKKIPLADYLPSLVFAPLITWVCS